MTQEGVKIEKEKGGKTPILCHLNHVVILLQLKV